MSLDWLGWSQRLNAIAQIGLTYAEDAYDKERYEQIREIAVEIAATHTDAEPDHIHVLFTHDRGYMTPKVDVRGIVFQDEKILLVREQSDGLWTAPGGWADIGDSPSEAVEREIYEESGYEAKAIKLLAVYDRNKHNHPPIEYYVYKMFFLCQITGGEASNSHETTGVDFFAEDNLPPLSKGRITETQIKHFFQHKSNADWATDFD